MSHRINRGEQMADETSSLTVAKLKALCVINDLATSGKKAELVERLLEAGLSRNDVGLSEAESTPEPVEEAEEEEEGEEEDCLLYTSPSPRDRG